jgi:hypothetical protein
MVHPTENHKQVWADAHALVPFRQAHGAPSFPMFGTHMYGEFPSFHSGSSLSMAFRGLGVIKLL